MLRKATKEEIESMIGDG